MGVHNKIALHKIFEDNSENTFRQIWRNTQYLEPSQYTMGTYLDKPRIEKNQESGFGNGLRYGISSMQGWRIEMEDAHSVILGVGRRTDWSFFAIFDGHAGSSVSSYCATELLECIRETEEYKKGIYEKAMQQGFLLLDRKLRNLPGMDTGIDKSGSTAVCALVTPERIFVANCGDSRAVISRSGKVVLSTRDHKPCDPVERKRIINAGGEVLIQRVNGSLAVSRALGDFDYKNHRGKSPCEQLVSPEPDVYVVERDAKDEFLLLACDGIWDVMTNEAVCDYVRHLLCITDDLRSITGEILDACLYKGSRDNMSVVLVALPGAPKLSPKAVKLDRDLDEVIRVKVADILSQRPGADFAHVMNVIGTMLIPNLPPGGGLSGKRRVIERLYREMCPDLAETIMPGVLFPSDISRMLNTTFDGIGEMFDPELQK